MTEQKHLIWSNYALDYEDWRADLEADYPELSEDDRMALMYEINSDYLDDERANLNIQLGQPILIICRPGPMDRAAYWLQGDRKRQHPGLPVQRPGHHVFHLVC